MKTVDEITREFCGGQPPKAIREIDDAIAAVTRMIELRQKLGLEEEDLFELCACCGLGVVACWRRNYKFCRDGGISFTKLYQDAAMLAMMSKEGAMIKTWTEEQLPAILEEVHACETQEESDQLWMAYCCAAYRYGMAFEQLVLNVETA